MRKRYEYLTDKDFLKEVDYYKIKEQYAKITVLDWAENEIKEVQGLITDGNINLNGQSSVRRTCNLNVYLDNQSYSNVIEIDNLFSINKKVYLEIGIKNPTDRYKEYDILWYPQGLFVMINPSINHSTGGSTLSLQLKDKMCLLNGECGGTIPASTQFDKYETIDENGEYVVEKPTIYQIITELVNHIGGEQLGKILISDVDRRIKQVMKWVGQNPVYRIGHGENSYMTTDDSEIQEGMEVYTFNYGDDVGFIYTDFTYPGDLIANAGDNVCTILDKIKNLLGNFEYFYDVDGFFHFQEIKNYLNTSKAKIEIDKINNSDYIIDEQNGKSFYSFDNNILINSFSNSPQYNMIKNDFIVWGIRKNADNRNVPIRYHLAIDNKPKEGGIHKGFFYIDPDDGLEKVKVPIVYKNLSSIEKNPGMAGVFYLASDTNKIYKWNTKERKYEEIDVELTNIKANDWRTELYLQGTGAEPLATDSNYYYAELNAEWPKMYNMKASKINNNEEVYEGSFYEEVLKNPTDIDFFLDFIGSNASISKFNISSIGRRSIVINDNKINCIFEPDLAEYPVIIEKGQPDTEEKREECQKKNQNFTQVDSSIYQMLATGGMKNSAYNKVRELLYQYTSYNESISIQSLPVYYLEPNTMIEVNDIESNIYGNFMISSISIPLSIGGGMSISATKALERI